MNIIRRFRSDRNGTALATRPAVQHPLALHSEIESFFDRMWRELDAWSPFRLADWSPWPQVPAMDVTENDQQLSITVDLPGFRQDDIDVEVTGNVLTIRGSRNQEQQQQDQRTLIRERMAGAFERSFTLPDYVDAERLEARYADGVLTLTAPKNPAMLPRKVKIAA